MKLHGAKGCTAVFGCGDECLCGFEEPAP